VLLLVFADGHRIAAVEQDVGGHEDGIVEEPDADALALAPAGLVLELRHSVRLTEAGDAAQHPGQLRVLGHLTLYEQRASGRVNTCRQQLGCSDVRALAQFLRRVLDGDGVHVRDEVERLEHVLQRNPLAKGTEVVAQVIGVGSRLGTREHAWSAVSRHERILPATCGLGSPGD